jgi:hypothetical protein
MLKVTQRIESATGEYGKLSMELIRNGEDISVTVRSKEGVLSGKQPLKFHFLSVEEMRDLQACLSDAISFLGGK